MSSTNSKINKGLRKAKNFPRVKHLAVDKKWEGFLEEVLRCVQESGAPNFCRVSTRHNAWHKAFYLVYGGVAKEYKIPNGNCRFDNFRNKIVELWTSLECLAPGENIHREFAMKQYDRYKSACVHQKKYLHPPEDLSNLEISRTRRTVDPESILNAVPRVMPVHQTPATMQALGRNLLEMYSQQRNQYLFADNPYRSYALQQYILIRTIQRQRDIASLCGPSYPRNGMPNAVWQPLFPRQPPIRERSPICQLVGDNVPISHENSPPKKRKTPPNRFLSPDGSTKEDWSPEKKYKTSPFQKNQREQHLKQQSEEKPKNSSSSSSSDLQEKQSSTNVAFLRALHHLLQFTSDCNCEEIISWVGGGTAFVVHNRKLFSNFLLPHHFSGSHQLQTFESFVDTLQALGFCIYPIDHVNRLPSKENKTKKEQMIFFHPDFQRGNPSILGII
jgi:hypothetical protein